jgi:hypothetical protein
MEFASIFHFSLLSLLVLVVPYERIVLSQQPRGIRVRVGFPVIPGHERLQLVANRSVQKDLELTEHQKEDVKRVANDTQTKFQAMLEHFRSVGDSSETSELRQSQLRAKGCAGSAEIGILRGSG